MSMTKSEFKKRYRELCSKYDFGEPPDWRVSALVEEAGFEWAPEPTPEPTGDLTMVRVIDAKGDTWRKGKANDWVCFMDGFVGPWSMVPQPATVLRPEGGAS